MIEKTNNFFYSIPKIHSEDIKTLSQLLDYMFPVFLISKENTLKTTIELEDSTLNGIPWLYQSKTHSIIPKLPEDYSDNPSEGALPQTPNPNESAQLIVTKKYLQEVAYGIQSLSTFHPKRTLLMVSKKLSQLKKSAHEKNSPIHQACDLFLEYLKEAIKLGKTQVNKPMASQSSNPLIVLVKDQHAFTKSKKNTKTKSITGLAEAIAKDIYLMNSLAFLNLPLPMESNDNHPALTVYFNRLVEFFSEPFLSLKNPKEHEYYLALYLEIFKKLIVLKDYHGAGAIALVFKVHDNTLDKLKMKENLGFIHDLFSPSRNYLPLRQIMNLNPGIPYFPLVCRDLEFAKQGNKNLMNQIEIYGKIYLDLSSKKTVVYQQRNALELNYKTNLVTLINQGTPVEGMAISNQTDETELTNKSQETTKNSPQTTTMQSTTGSDTLDQEPLHRRSTMQSLSHNVSRFFSDLSNHDKTEDEEKESGLITLSSANLI